MPAAAVRLHEEVVVLADGLHEDGAGVMDVDAGRDQAVRGVVGGGEDVVPVQWNTGGIHHEAQPEVERRVSNEQQRCCV